MAWRRRGAEVCADLSAVRRLAAGCYTGEVPEQRRKEFFIWECYFMFFKKPRRTTKPPGSKIIIRL